MSRTRVLGKDKPGMPQPRRRIWAYLTHLGRNNWEDHPVDGSSRFGTQLLWDDRVWEALLPPMRAAGVNMIVLDLGDGVRYDSYPEIGVRNAWSTARLKTEVARLRETGFEPIPKLNFATTHDVWMGEYARCVSTPRYYRFCEELIREVAELFDRPRFFHLGMDEESVPKQKQFEYVAVRQFDLWWHDLDFYCEQVVRAGGRPWIWSDYAWDHPWEYFQRMPRDVLQSNWYYRRDFSPGNVPAQCYAELERNGYDQVPTASNYYDPANFGMTVEHALRVIHPDRLLGFMQTPWKGPREETHRHNLEAIEQLAAARRASDPV